MSYEVLSPQSWARREFGGVGLGDKRLDQRAVLVAGAMAADPSGSLPQQNKQWKKIKGAYRLFDHQRSTFTSLIQPHWQRTRALCGEHPVVLLIQDTTWLDYASHPQTQGLGWYERCEDKEGGHGLMLHSVLAVSPQGTSGQVLGLAWGKLWARSGEPHSDAKFPSKRRRSGDRESLRWSEAMSTIGSPPPQAVRWIHVGDRESDIFELYRQAEQLTGVGFVIRMRHDRGARIGHDPAAATVPFNQRKHTSLKDLCRAMPTLGQTKLWIAPNANRAGRWATLNVSASAVTLFAPQVTRTGKSLCVWALRAWEADAPVGAKPLEWMLLTSEPMSSIEDALRVAGYYGLRWLIEQYHQCLKSGCRVEQRQLESADRLQPLIGMLCVLAVRLLQLKNDARLTPDAPADQCVGAELPQTLARLKNIDLSALTVRRFTHEVAKLGGFIGRKSDGDPGWLTLWRGWKELSLIHAGYQLAELKPRYG